MSKTKEEIFNEIKPIIVTHLSTTGNPRDPFESKVTLSAKLEDDLEADSLDRVELVMAYEEHFEIELPDEAMEACDTVGEHIDIIYGVLNP